MGELPATGRAARFVAPGTAQIGQEPVPAAADLADGLVLVRTRWASVCGSDLHVVGTLERERYPMPPGYPGHEGVGQVVASASLDFAVGDWVLQLPDRAWCYLFADYHLTADTYLVKLPDGDRRLVDYLMAQQLGTVLFALERYLVPPTPCRVATVVGLGSAGLHFVQLLRARGFERVVAADLVPERVAWARRLGVADAVVLEPGESVVEATMAISGGIGANLTIDASSTDEGRALAMRCVAQDGTIELFGLPSGALTPVPLSEVFRKNVTLRTAVAAQHDPGIPTFHEAVRLIRDREIVVEDMVTHTVALEQLTDGVRLAEDRSDGVIKVAVDMTA